MPATTAAVVVAWNSGDSLARAVASLVEAGITPGRIVVVDNASRDGAVGGAEADHPGLVVLRNPVNAGFGAAANQGATAALDGGADQVLFLNDDAWFPPGELSRLCAVLESNPRLGLVGPRVLLPGDPPRVWAAGGLRGGGPNLSTLRGHGRPDGPAFEESVGVDYLPGCALLVTRAAWEDLGGFEESYFAYMEDVELGVRAHAAGWQPLCVGQSRCFHEASSSTGGGYTARRKYMNALNGVHFLRSHGRPGEWVRFALLDVLALPLVWLIGLLSGRGRAVTAKGLGIWHGLIGRRMSPELLEPGGTALW